MKNELLKDMRFRNIEEVWDAVANVVDFYNNESSHMSIDMMTPIQTISCEGELKKWWINYRVKAIKEKDTDLEIPDDSLLLFAVLGLTEWRSLEGDSWSG